MNRIFIFAINLLFVSLLCNAQTGLSVDSIFSDYGKRQGSVFLDISKDILGEHTRIERFKCLRLKQDNEAASAIVDAVKNDYESSKRFDNALVIKEMTENGVLKNATYCLGKADETPVGVYLLYSVNNGNIMLVYLTGRFKPSELNNELNKLKDLFIKVNNKEIKIY